MKDVDFDVFGENDNGFSNESQPAVNALPLFKEKATMNELEIEGIIKKIEALCKRSVSCVKAAKNRRNDNNEQFSWAMYQLEKATLLVRKLANELLKEEESIQMIEDRLAFTYSLDGDIAILDFPVLMPKRKPNLRTSYYVEKLEEMVNSHGVPEVLKTKKTAIVVLHCYEKSHALWEKKDHDNIDLKWIIDALNNHFFIDDGPFRTTLYQHSTIDSEDHTVIYLVPLTVFPEFLAKHIPQWDEWQGRVSKIEEILQK